MDQRSSSLARANDDGVTSRTGARSSGVTVSDGRELAPDEHSGLADAHRHHSDHGPRWNGDGESNVLGMVHGRDHWNRHFVWRSPDRDLGPRYVRRLIRHERTKRGTHCRRSVCGGHAAADAVGCHLLGAALQRSLYNGGLSPHQESPDVADCGANSWNLRAPVRAGRKIL